MILTANPSNNARVKRISSRGGRPTPEQAQQITERLIEAAENLFFAQGFEATSIDAIVSKAKISKRHFTPAFCQRLISSQP